MKQSPRSAQPKLRTLKILAVGLDEISDHFVWEDFVEIPGVESSQASLAFGGETEADPTEKNDKEDDQDGEDDEEDDEEHYEDISVKTFDKEEVEVAIDVFLSHQLKRGTIQKAKNGRLPSFSEVFESIFGKKHPATVLAATFEDHIAGYFGWIDYENMEAAYGELMEIQDLVTKAIEAERV